MPTWSWDGFLLSAHMAVGCQGYPCTCAGPVPQIPVGKQHCGSHSSHAGGSAYLDQVQCVPQSGVPWGGAGVPPAHPCLQLTASLGEPLRDSSGFSYWSERDVRSVPPLQFDLGCRKKPAQDQGIVLERGWYIWVWFFICWWSRPGCFQLCTKLIRKPLYLGQVLSTQTLCLNNQLCIWSLSQKNLRILSLSSDRSA